MDWPQCTHDDKIYAELKKKVVAACEGKHFSMNLISSDYETVARAWNQGIDSHLEALTPRSTVDVQERGIFGPRAAIRIHPEELPVLVRRLFEDFEQGHDLVTSILSTLDIEVF